MDIQLLFKTTEIQTTEKRRETNSFEMFIELIKNYIFKPNNYRKIKNNISNEERKAQKYIQKDKSKTNCKQYKGSLFVALDSDIEKIGYIEKIDR